MPVVQYTPNVTDEMMRDDILNMPSKKAMAHMSGAHAPLTPKTVTWYLAHPLTSDRRFSFQQNVEHISTVMAQLWRDAMVLTIAPYLEQIKFLNNENQNDRFLGLDSDKQVVRALDRIILVGHRLTAGMQEELDALSPNGQVINCIGIPDVRLYQFIPRRLI